MRGAGCKEGPSSELRDRPYHAFFNGVKSRVGAAFDVDDWQITPISWNKSQIQAGPHRPV